jgi:hypothetical protein
LHGLHPTGTRRQEGLIVSTRSHRINEIEVTMSISDGKLTVESRSGPKSGSVELSVVDSGAELTIHSAGNDQATATLTGAELSNFRTNVDSVMSSMVSDRADVPQDKRVLASGFESLGQVGGGFATTIDTQALQTLGIVDETGSIPGGSRQIKCTILNSGTAILNLLSDDEPGFNF